MLVSAEEQATKTGKEKFGLPDNTQVSWFCSNNSTLMNFPARFRKLLHSNQPPPTILIMHLGTIDMGMFNAEKNVVNIHNALDAVKKLVPECTILWSEILPRLCKLQGVTIETMGKKRKHMNFCTISAVHQLHKAYVLRHDNFDYLPLYQRNNSLRLTPMGHDKLLREFRDGLKMAAKPGGHEKCYPSCEGHGSLGRLIVCIKVT